MFKKIEEYINKLKESRQNNIDASQFNDDVATRTSWEAIKTPTANFNARKLIKDNRNLLKYKTTIGMKLFGGLFILSGVGIISVIGELLVSLLLIAAGTYMLYFASSPIVFDRNKGIFFKGRGKKRKSFYIFEIYALQLIPNYVSDSDGRDYYNYQINIVFKDGKRFNVTTYSNAEIARKDSKIISNFIYKKLWDALLNEEN